MIRKLYLGLLSGTSMDGVDCALIARQGNDTELLDFISHPIPAELQERILALCRKENIAITRLGQLDVELGRLFADVVHHMLDRQQLSHDSITAVGSHGQTVWHQPAQGSLEDFIPFTLQIGDPNTICQRIRITTIADFRRKDMAAGGQGAPLVPAFHQAFFHSSSRDRVVVNVGGISNITVLCKDGIMPVQGFDTGPGNVLMDCWIQKVRGERYDHNGEWAASGQCIDSLLEHLLDEAYFSLSPPKSTGRELFNADWLTEKLLSHGGHLKPEDVQATLLELSAYTITAVIKQFFPEGEVLVCGGGANNTALMQALATQLPEFRVMSSNECGMHPDAVEAAAFAWMASKTLAREKIDFTTITGASEPGIAGGIYYYE